MKAIYFIARIACIMVAVVAAICVGVGSLEPIKEMPSIIGSCMPTIAGATIVALVISACACALHYVLSFDED